MKKLLLLSAWMCGVNAYSQTTIFEDDFEGGSGDWTLNSNDMSGSSVTNHWVINNSYAGGSGSFVCLGFPFSFTVNATQSQPAGISGPNGNYLHISSLAGESSGITNANFMAADGICTFDESNFTKMTNAISTVGYTNVTLSFWSLIGGEAGTVSGEVYYSLDNGSSWILKTGNMNNITSWTNNTLSDAAWDNVASLKIAFRFLNTTASAPIDPSFSLDDVIITGTPAASVSVSTGAITSTTYCSDNTTNILVPFTVTGTVNAGNVYTAQLSNSAGSFASPTAIGTLSSAATGTLSISATIPGGLPAGNGYRIRVDASDPAATGTDNGMDLTIAAPPSITVTPTPATICVGNSASIAASGANAFTWSPAATLSSATGSNVTATPTSTQVYTVTGTDVNGCSSSTTVTITVESCAGLEESSSGYFELYPNPANRELALNFGELKGIHSVSVLDLSGRTVLSDKMVSNTIDVSSLKSGKYFLIIEHEAGNSVKAFVKE